MNLQLLKFHKLTLAICLITVTALVVFNFSAGELKPKAQFDWTDILGEGGIALMTLLWIFFILISRPNGSVTRLLVAGLLFLHASLLLDLLDEFLTFNAHPWISDYQALPAPFGMILMSIALYQWHQEQTLLNRQLGRFENGFREYTQSDYITGLYSMPYFFAEIEKLNIAANNYSVLLIDIDNFENFVEKYGDNNADRMLNEVARIMGYNLRLSDLICRYAGDRFAVLLPGIEYKNAVCVAEQLENAVSSFGFKPELEYSAENLMVKPVYLGASIALTDARPFSSSDSLFKHLNQDMERIKRAKRSENVA